MAVNNQDRKEGRTGLKKIALVVKSEPHALATADQLETWLKARHAQVVRREGFEPHCDLIEMPVSEAPEDLLAVFVLGGDGTFLSAVRWIGRHSIPILGIKFGEVGFLAEVSEEGLWAAAESILRHEFTIRPRMRLSVRVVRQSKEIARGTVLNDVVINRGVLARLAHIETCINDNYLTDYRADGLIVATPTGSTAYSLAAGGPVVHPSVPAILLSPICPFTLTNRPLIIPDTAIVRMRLAQNSSDIRLTLDGQVGMEIDERDTIIVKKSNHPVHLITIPGQDYFDLLKTKLKWSGGKV
jgi:NAD+ kinase